MTDDMALPEGRTCGDCYAFRYCSGTMIHCKPTNTRCDWSPSRFVKADKPAESPADPPD